MSLRLYPCPSCDEEVSFAGDPPLVTCGECGVRLKVSTDYDYEDGRWHDLTSLTVVEAQVQASNAEITDAK